MSTDATAAPARERLLDAAERLFYAHGITATGIDTVTAEAGVAKKTLYNNFGSKDDLVVAAIERRHAEWLALYDARLATARTPEERVLAVFDAYIDHANGAYEHGFRGCGLLNAAAELPAGSAGREAVRAHKDAVEHILADHMFEHRTARSDEAAEHLSYLLEGAMTRAGLDGAPDRLHAARRIAVDLIDSL